MVKNILVSYDSGFLAYSEYFKRKTGNILADDELIKMRNIEDTFNEYLFESLSEVGIDVLIFSHDYDGAMSSSLNSLEVACESAELIIHSTPQVGAFQCEDDVWMETYQQKVENLIFSKFLHKTDFHSRTKEITDKRSSNKFAKLNDISIPKTWTMETYLSDVRTLPVLFKTPDDSRSEGNLFLDRVDQLELFFDENVNAKCGRTVPNSDLYDVQEYINTPSNHYTSYRIFTLGDGTILGAVLGVSGNKKDQLVRRAYPSNFSFEDTLMDNFQRKKELMSKDDILVTLLGASVYDHVQSPLYLGLLDVFSNSSVGGSQIALSPTFESKISTSYEKEILVEHGINPNFPKLPDRLESMAKHVAKTFAPHGVLYTGQDWLQDRDGNFYFLEVNSGPGLNIFNTLYNFGTYDDVTAMEIGAKKLAEALKTYSCIR